MTIAARNVLADCEEAVAEFVDGIQGSAWRRRWITAVVLLRTVGHVLDKVDSQRSLAHQRAICEGWAALQKSKPQPLIFWAFIDDERNSILKEYRLAAGQGVTVRPGLVRVDATSGNQMSEAGLPPLYDYDIHEGPFKGRDQRDVLREAIDWWRTYLDGVEDRIATFQSGEETTAV